MKLSEGDDDSRDCVNQKSYYAHLFWWETDSEIKRLILMDIYECGDYISMPAVAIPGTSNGTEDSFNLTNSHI